MEVTGKAGLLLSKNDSIVHNYRKQDKFQINNLFLGEEGGGLSLGQGVVNSVRE